MNNFDPQWLRTAAPERRSSLDENADGRVGSWMQTSLGGRFYPGDPRPEEIFVSDIANGIAQEQRYMQAKDIRVQYTVAEHCWLLTQYALRQGVSPALAMAVLFHDAAEGYYKDMPRAVKKAIGAGYKTLETRCQDMIAEKYGFADEARQFKSWIKELDERIVPHEKARVIRHDKQAWKHDAIEPLPGVNLECWQPAYAKEQWLRCYSFLCDLRKMKPERWEI
jgi:hypothetical protein